jgi:hypothetical protein
MVLAAPYSARACAAAWCAPCCLVCALLPGVCPDAWCAPCCQVCALIPGVRLVAYSAPCCLVCAVLPSRVCLAESAAITRLVLSRLSRSLECSGSVSMVLSQGPTSPSRPNHEFDGLVRSAGFGYLRTPYKSGGYWQ